MRILPKIARLFFGTGLVLTMYAIMEPATFEARCLAFIGGLCIGFGALSDWGEDE